MHTGQPAASDDPSLSGGSAAETDETPETEDLMEIELDSGGPPFFPDPGDVEEDQIDIGQIEAVLDDEETGDETVEGCFSDGQDGLPDDDEVATAEDDTDSFDPPLILMDVEDLDDAGDDDDLSLLEISEPFPDGISPEPESQAGADDEPLGLALDSDEEEIKIVELDDFPPQDSLVGGDGGEDEALEDELEPLLIVNDDELTPTIEIETLPVEDDPGPELEMAADPAETVPMELEIEPESPLELESDFEPPLVLEIEETEPQSDSETALPDEPDDVENLPELEMQADEPELILEMETSEPGLEVESGKAENEFDDATELTDALASGFELEMVEPGPVLDDGPRESPSETGSGEKEGKDGAFELSSEPELILEMETSGPDPEVESGGTENEFDDETQFSDAPADGFELEMDEAEPVLDDGPGQSLPEPDSGEEESEEESFELSFGIEIEQTGYIPSDSAEGSAEKLSPPALQDPTWAVPPATGGETPAAEKTSVWKRTLSVPVPVIALAVVAVVVVVAVMGFLAYPGPKTKTGSVSGITVIDPRGRIVENVQGGSLYVITGRVRNDGPSRCHRIGILGRVYTKNGFAKSVKCYGGHEPSDSELATANPASLMAKLASAPYDAGGNEIHLSIGQSLPFTLVFNDLPSDLSILEKFSVEVTSVLP